MVHICDALVRYDSHNPYVSENVTFCLTSLEDMRARYAVARPLLYMFRITIKDLGISISDDLERRLEASVRLDPDELLDACTRLTYKQPISQILINTETGLTQSFVDRWKEVTEEGNKQMDIGVY